MFNSPQSIKLAGSMIVVKANNHSRCSGSMTPLFLRTSRMVNQSEKNPVNSDPAATPIMHAT